MVQSSIVNCVERNVALSLENIKKLVLEAELTWCTVALRKLQKNFSFC